MEIMKKEIYDLNERKFPEKISFKTIGIIHSPFKSLKGIPIQPSMSKANGIIEIFPEYQPALKDLNGFSHIYCLYYFDMVKLPVPLQSKPFLDNNLRDVFAMRTPFRPNLIGISILKILKIKQNQINVMNVDILDKTPVLDVKPYVPEFDLREKVRIGLLEGKIQ